MTRRTRRRAYVVAVAALVGVTAPLWAPPALSRVPLFGVEEVGVVGARWVPPDEVVRRAGVEPGASVWDDPARWERRVETHPLVREARVSRTGLHTLEIQVRETEPVALAATPELVAVDATGRVLPLDPSTSGLDLPILPGARLEEGRLAEDGGRRLLRVLVALREAEPGFVRRVSHLVRGEHGGVELAMADGEAAARLLLPEEDPVRALRRVEMALGHHGGAGPVEVADARFDGQVVLEGPGLGREGET